MTHIISTDPSLDFAPIGSIIPTSHADIVSAVDISRSAGKEWSHTPISTRVGALRSLYDLCVSEREILAQSVAREMGMPIRIARDDIGYGLQYFSWYLDHAEMYLSPEVTYETDIEIHTVHYEPKGVIAAITPWNYPFMLFVWACIQPLLAGNTVIWKISKEVILTGELIASLFERVGFPRGVWQEIYGDGSAGDTLTDQDIDGITFTGSTSVGRRLADKAHEKNITAIMELGGSAPGIVCADADIDSVLDTIYFMRFSNSGQMCDGLKRLIVHSSRYDEVVEKLSAKLMSKQIGHALDESADIGPLVSISQVAHFQSQYDDAIALGATVLASIPILSDLHGAYVSPTIFGHVTREMKIWKEEVFGPMLPIVTFETYEEAISLANDTEYGLGAYIFTESVEIFTLLAREIESGMVQMNNVNYCIPADPFGGYKSSGIGREHGKWGFYELSNVKVLSRPKK